MRLQWNPDTLTTPNGWSIQGEQVRGEGRFYWLIGCPAAAHEIIAGLPPNDAIHGSYDKRSLQRACQRVQDVLDAEHCVPE